MAAEKKVIEVGSLDGDEMWNRFACKMDVFVLVKVSWR